MAKKKTSSTTGKKKAPAKSVRTASKSGSATSAKKKTAKKTTPKVAKKTVKKKTTAAKKKTVAKKATRKTAKKTVSKKATKKKVVGKKVAKKTSKKAGNNGDAVAPPKPRVVKTHLSADDLAEFKELLLEKRRELVGDMTNLETEALRESSGGSSSMPIHMADLGSDTWEQELTFGLIENERGLIREIDEALERIENKTYGVCLATYRPIAKTRLRIKPWAKYCIAYARKKELGLA